MLAGSTQMGMEVSFSLLYLVTVWRLVIAMLRHLPGMDGEKASLGRCFILAFGLLALGDTGLVGFRVIAYMAGDMDATISLFGSRVGLIGQGALSQAITVTFFYVIVLVIWHVRTVRPYGRFVMALFALVAVCIIIMMFPQNQWNSIVPPQPGGLYRNMPLMIPKTMAYIAIAFLVYINLFKTPKITEINTGGYHLEVLHD